MCMCFCVHVCEKGSHNMEHTLPKCDGCCVQGMKRMCLSLKLAPTESPNSSVSDRLQSGVLLYS